MLKLTIQALLAVAIGAALTVSPVAAEIFIPRGYYLKMLSSESAFNRWTSINNSGQIVWSAGLDPFDGNTYEIMMYDKATDTVVNLSQNNVYDDYPDINDNGDVVWSSGVGPGGVLEIARLHGGKLSYLTDESASVDPRSNSIPQINDFGQVVWRRRVDTDPCAPTSGHILFFDGLTTRTVTPAVADYYFPFIAGDGDVFWSYVDWCPPEAIARVVRWRNGVASEITTAPPSNGTIGVGRDSVALTIASELHGERVSLLDTVSGEITPISEWGYNGRVSPNGRFFTFNRYYVELEAWQIFRADRRDAFNVVRISDEPIWNFDAKVNDEGELAWVCCDYPYYQIRALLRYAGGDLNCDGFVSISDIPAFVAAIANPVAYDGAWPTCDPLLADFNDDGQVSVADIGWFVLELSR